MRAGLIALLNAAMIVAAIVTFPSGVRASSAFPDRIALDLSLGQTPEGIAADKAGNIYVSMQAWSGQFNALTDQLWKFSRTGEMSVVADFPPPGGGRCGLAIDATGTVYMVRNALAGTPDVSGVYRVERNGDVSRLPGTEQMSLPNALAFDQRGNLYITEMFTWPAPGTANWGPGGIWRVPKNGGTAEPWLYHDLLTGLINPLYGFPVGANGLQFFRGALYAMNVDKMLIVRVPIRPDGSPGTPEVWKQIENVPAEPVGFLPMMNDGLAMDVHGNAYVTATTRLAILRIDAKTREQTIAAAWPDVPLDAPVNLVFGTGAGERQNLFVSNMGVAVLVDPTQAWPGPGLVKINVGVPGAPLP